MPPTRKSIPFYILTFVLVFLSILVILEIFARYMIYQQGAFLQEIDKPYWQKLVEKDPAYEFAAGIFYVLDPRYGFSHLPGREGSYRGFSYPYPEFRNKIKINWAGFRSDEEYDFKTSKFRIAVLGDSFVQALQVQEKESMVKVIEKILVTQGKSVEAYNFGVSNYGTINEYRVFEERVLDFNPKGVILAFFPNDLIDNSPLYHHEHSLFHTNYLITREGEVVIKDPSNEPPLPEISYHFPLENRMRSVDYLVNFLKIIEKRFGYLYSVKYFRFYFQDNFQMQYGFDPALDIYKRAYSAPLKESLYVTLQLIGRMNKSCEKKNIKFLAVLLPSAEQIKEKTWNKYVYLRRHAFKPEDFDLNYPNALVEEGLKSRGVEVLNLLPLIRRQPDKERLFYQKDPHLNARGHQRVGQLIADFLTQLKWFD